MSLEKTNKKSRFLNLKFALLGMSLAGAASSISKNAVSTIASDSNHIVAHADEVTNQTQDQNNGVYTVKSGDTLSEIAENHNMKLDDLYKLNTKYNSQNTLIFPGDQINVADNGQVQQAQPQQTQQQTQQAAPVQQQPQQQAPAQQAAPQQRTQTSYQSNVSGNDAAAKAWIASRESGGNYNARNGQYIGKYQLSASYLGGDYSPAHQEAVADQYVANRYGSWSNAQQFWMSHGWY